MQLPKCQTLGLSPSFGFGDRTGLATPGHVLAMQRDGAGIEPIFPQQSIREMSRTQRTAVQVMGEALSGAAAAGWTGITGADADHLKTPDDVDVTATAGFMFFTIDPSGAVDQRTDSYSEQELRERFAAVRDTAPWFEAYRGRQVGLSTGTVIRLDEQACMRAAVKYGAAIQQAISLSHYIARVQTAAGRDFEIELSVDETDQPTTLAEHLIIAEQCLQASGLQILKLFTVKPDLFCLKFGHAGTSIWETEREESGVLAGIISGRGSRDKSTAARRRMVGKSGPFGWGCWWVFAVLGGIFGAIEFRCRGH